MITGYESRTAFAKQVVEEATTVQEATAIGSKAEMSVATTATAITDAAEATRNPMVPPTTPQRHARTREKARSKGFERSRGS
jgi:hypothetical protein